MPEVQNVTKRYRGIPAVEDVSFTIKAGKILGYLGPNGSGKSTTVKMITGTSMNGSGKVMMAIKIERKRHGTSVGVFQNRARGWEHAAFLYHGGTYRHS